MSSTVLYIQLIRETYYLVQRVVSIRGVRCWLRTDFHLRNSQPRLGLSSSFYYVLPDVSGSSSSLRQIPEQGET